MEKQNRNLKLKISYYFKHIVKFLFSGNNKYYVIIKTLFQAITTGMSVIILKYILDMVKLKETTITNIVIVALAYSLIFVVLKITSIILKNKIYFIITEKRLNYFSDMMKKIMTMDFAYFEDAKFNLKVEQAISGIAGEDSGFTLLNLNGIGLIENIFIAIIFIIILIKQSFLIIFIVLFSVVLNLIFANKYSKFVYANKDARTNELRKFNKYRSTINDFSYGKDIRIFRLKKRLLDNINLFIKRFTRAVNKEYKYKFKLSFFENLIVYASDFASIAVLVYLTSIGKLEVSDLVMLLSLIVIFSNTIYSIKDQLAKILENMPYYMDTVDFFESNLNLNKDGKNIDFKGPVKIKFENVSFKYPGTENYVFEDLSFEIEAGKKIAVVGVNGAGKTTIVKLMTGLHRPESGKIYINDIDMMELSDDARFKLFSVVFQETEPLAMSVAENIAVKSTDIDFDKVKFTLEKVGLWDKISKFEKTYNQELLKVLYEDGQILSGGENQKLMIARALYKPNTSVMIMDEPTSALDAFAEQKIYQEFDTYMGHKTGIFISHRLASTKFCDEIMFLDGGKIVAKDTHENLLRKCEEYRNMFETQGKYYKEVGNA
ncbi:MULTISPECIES: ABC transporter ATP-binding protein [Helcococcus]|uniref:ABC transporter ATP-binding protein n=1 Tax=Helcococcus bovis TaxID=3153252 RepID=A0ABW9F597_9FIRM